MLGSVIAISEAVSLGVHGMGLLAASGRRLNARDVAQTLGVSEAHLTKGAPLSAPGAPEEAGTTVRLNLVAL